MTLSEARGNAPGVIAIIRLRRNTASDQLFEAIVAGGVTSVEVTLPTPGSADSIARWAGTPGVRVGAGTVRTPDDVHRAADAGAEFLVTPATSLAVLEAARSRRLSVVCGALTPTEIETATSLGADWVKVFPADALGGVDYLKALAGPYSLSRLVPTGGVSLANIADYAALGCAGVGVGSSLVNEAAVEAAIAEGDWSGILDTSREISEQWAEGLARAASDSRPQ